MRPLRILFVLILLVSSATLTSLGQWKAPSRAIQAMEEEKEQHLTILWTSGDRNIFMENIEPYFKASFEDKTMKDLTLIAWGPAIELFAEDEAVQKELALLIEKGLQVKASENLAIKYGCKERLMEIGVEISNINELLTRFLMNENQRIVSL